MTNQFPPQTKQQLLDYLNTFDPKKYAKTRNFVDGNVSRLSPYITHGVITTKECVEKIFENHDIKSAEKFLMELVWKEFWMQVQRNYGNAFVHEAIRDDKTNIQKSDLIPESLMNAQTDTKRVNDSVLMLQQEGRLHNHIRMRFASRCIHRAKLDRKKLADWTYYHFIDGELSSNHLSRQRVNSTFANKPYFMNEGNLQKYWKGTEDHNLRGTYEKVGEKLFNPERTSPYWKESDMYDTLVTPLENIKKYCQNCLGDHTHVQILTPWKLDEQLLGNDIHTLIVLDSQFTQLHPRSQHRLDRVQQYADQYHVKFVLGDYQSIIHEAIDKGMHVTIDQRYDPIYREACDHFVEHEEVTIIDYPWIRSDNGGEPIMKFFKYWNKAKKELKQ